MTTPNTVKGLTFQEGESLEVPLAQSEPGNFGGSSPSCSPMDAQNWVIHQNPAEQQLCCCPSPCPQPQTAWGRPRVHPRPLLHPHQGPGCPMCPPSPSTWHQVSWDVRQPLPTPEPAVTPRHSTVGCGAPQKSPADVGGGPGGTCSTAALSPRSSALMSPPAG